MQHYTHSLVGNKSMVSVTTEKHGGTQYFTPDKTDAERASERSAAQERARQEELRAQKEVEEAAKNVAANAQNTAILKLEAELVDLRNKAVHYRPGDFHFPGYIPQGILPNIRMAVVGQTGSGKSCLINTTGRAVSGKDLTRIPAGEGIVSLEYIFTEYGFVYVDIRGFFQNSASDSLEFIRIVDGDTKHGQRIDRAAITGPQPVSVVKTGNDLKDRVHGVIFVVKANDPRLNTGAYQAALKFPRDHCRELEISPITVVTHEDQLPNEEAKIAAREFASSCTGSSLDHTFLIANYTRGRKERSLLTELAALQILRYALTMAETHVNIYLARQALASPLPTSAPASAVASTQTFKDLMVPLEPRFQCKCETHYFSDEQGCEYDLDDPVGGVGDVVYLHAYEDE
ncbi:E3 ubiquitin-protein ligase TRIM56 [Pelomyxa schiedti]|nr:E3 ubiquitin-protein ligase TRIM56 [Pelomyxa schiedti]